MPYSPTFFFSSGNLPIATRTRLRAAMGIFRFSAYPLFRLSTNAIKDTVSVLYWYEELSRRNSGNFWNSSSELFFVSFLFGGGWGGPGGGDPQSSALWNLVPSGGWQGSTSSPRCGCARNAQNSFKDSCVADLGGTANSDPPPLRTSTSPTPHPHGVRGVVWLWVWVGLGKPWNTPLGTTILG